MPSLKSSLRLTLYRTEKTKWRQEAQKHRMTLSQFVRIVMNGRLHIPTTDLARKIERQQVGQMTIYDHGISPED